MTARTSGWIAAAAAHLAPAGLALLALAAAAGSASAQGRAPIRCPSEAELAELVRSAGTGSDSQRRVYLWFLDRYGRPAALNQHGNDSEVVYGSGRGTIRVVLHRDPTTGVVAIACQTGGGRRSWRP